MNISVYDDCIFFEFGNEKSSYAPQRTDLIAPFVVDFDSITIRPESLIIDKITLPSGEVVFENEDFAKCLDVVNKNAVEYEQKIKKEGRELGELDPVTAKLPEMIGKPLIIDGVRRGVLVDFLRVADSGSVIVEFLHGPGVCNDFINKDTRVQTTDLQGKIYLVEINGKTQEECEHIDKIFETRKQNIIAAKKANKASESEPEEPAGPQ